MSKISAHVLAATDLSELDTGISVLLFYLGMVPCVADGEGPVSERI